MRLFFKSKRKTAGFVVPARGSRRAQPRWWFQGIWLILILVVVGSVIAIGVGKRGLAKILSGNQIDKERILLIGQNSESAQRLGIISLSQNDRRISWLPNSMLLSSTVSASSTWMAKVGQSLAIPITSEFDFFMSHTSSQWGQDLDTHFWSALHLPREKRSLFYRLWLISRDHASEELSATTAADVRQELKLIPLLTAFNRDCPVMIINTTPMTGLGNRYSSFLEKEGLRVVRLDSDQTGLTESKVVVDDQLQSQCQKPAQIIQNMFSSAQATSQSDISRNYRAAIVVYLGLDGLSLAE